MVTSIIAVTAMQVADKLQVYTAYYMHGPKMALGSVILLLVPHNSYNNKHYYN